MDKIKSRISSYFRPLRDYKRKNYYLSKFGSPQPIYNILANNCIAGICYHDAGLEFLSPTINLTIDDFLLFCKHIDSYLSCEIEEIVDSNQNCPVGVIKHNSLPPIRIRFVHYNSFAEAKRKFMERSKRFFLRKERVCIIYTVPRSKRLDKSDLELFLSLNAYRKLCFYRDASVDLPANTSTSCFVHVPEKYQNMDYLKYIGLLSRKRYFDNFFNVYKFIFGNSK